MTKGVRSCAGLALSCLLVAPAAPAVGASGPAIVHEPLACIPMPMQNARIAAKITVPGAVTMARVMFRVTSGDNIPYSYLELRHSAATGEYFGTFPKAEESTREVEYRIVATDSENAEYTTDLMKVPVTKDCSVSLVDEEKKYSENLVIGLTADRQRTRPEGFLCDGIVSKITVDGILLPADPCPGGVLFALPVAAAALTGGVVITGGGTKAPVSPSRPGPPNP